MSHTKKKISVSRVLFVETILVFAALLGIVLGPSLVGSKVFAPDVYLQAEPYKSLMPASNKASRLMVGDIVNSLLPRRHIFFEEIKKGHLLKWDSFSVGGVPLGTVFNIGAFEPFSLPYYVLPFWLANAYSRLLALVGSFIFTYLFLRRLKLGRAAASLGGLVFVTSGFIIAWNNWPQDQVAAWIPALFWATERYLQNKSFRSMAIVPLIVAAMLLAGFPAVTGFALYALAAYVLVRLLFTSKRKIRALIFRGSLILLAVLIGGGLASFQVLPFLERLQTIDISMRGGLGHLDLSSMITFIVPFGLGNLTKAIWYGKFNYIESFSFVGAVALIFIGISFYIKNKKVPRGIQGFFIGSSLVTMVLIFYGGTLLHLTAHLPIFSNNFIGRARSILGFFLAALAAIGFDFILSGRRAYKARRRLLPVLFWLVFVAAGGWIYYVAAKQAHLAGQLRYLANNSLMPFVILIATGLVAWAIYHGFSRKRKLFLLLVPLLIAIEVLPVLLQWWPTTTRDLFFPSTPTHIFLRDNLGEERFAASNSTMFFSSSDYYRLRSVSGHAFANKKWATLLKQVDKKSRKLPTIIFLSPDLDVVESRLLDRMSVKYFVNAENVPLYGKIIKLDKKTGQIKIDNDQTVNEVIDSRPLRGLQIELSDEFTEFGDFTFLEATVSSTKGEVLAQGRKRIYKTTKGSMTIPVTGENIKVGEKIMISIKLSGSQGSLTLAAHDKKPLINLLVPNKDGIKLVYAKGDTVIWERQNSLPRIRWATKTKISEDNNKELKLINDDLAPDTILLDRPVSPISGRPAKVEIISDDGDRMKIKVRAKGDGYLVVADSLQQGWGATTDGESTDLLSADYAMAAVYVPEGEHQIILSYNPKGWVLGKKIALISLLVLVLIMVIDKRSRVLVGRLTSKLKTSKKIS